LVPAPLAEILKALGFKPGEACKRFSAASLHLQTAREASPPSEKSMADKQKSKSWFATLKSCVLTCQIHAGGNHAETDGSGVRFDLSDKTTFFAWQRNHMANERTFLAWCRTGISLIIFGFVIERFDLLIRELRTYSAHPEMIRYTGKTHDMGLIIFILGALIILMAGWRFFYIRRHINRGDTEFSVLPDVFLMVSILGTVVMIVLLFAFLV
jgi:putative membrane protein